MLCYRSGRAGNEMFFFRSSAMTEDRRESKLPLWAKNLLKDLREDLKVETSNLKNIISDLKAALKKFHHQAKSSVRWSCEGIGEHGIPDTAVIYFDVGGRQIRVTQEFDWARQRKFVRITGARKILVEPLAENAIGVYFAPGAYFAPED